MRYPLNFIGITQGYHYGKCLDFGWHKAPTDPVYSVADGKVIKVCVTPKGGNNVFIEHEGNIISNYCHLSKVLVKEGEEVKIGQQIANVGQTGTDATGPHLHFGLYSKGKNMYGNSDLDPFDYLEIYDGQKISSKTMAAYGSKIKFHKEEPTPEEPSKEEPKFKVGDIVVPINLVNYNGKKLRQYDKYYTITELVGDRAVLSAERKGKMVIWAAMNIKDIELYK